LAPLVGQLTTDNNGYAKSELLPYGDYYLKEINAPVGYVLSEINYPFSISENEVTIEVSATNDIIKGYIEIVKMSDNPQKAIEQGFGNEPLQGAVYGIYNLDGILIEELTTDENGYAKSNLLPYGDYYLREINAPAQYELDLTQYPFSISSSNTTISLDVKNEPIIGYIVAEYTPPSIDEYIYDKTPPTTNPQTGDKQLGVITLAFICLSIFAIIIFRKKRGIN